MMNRFVPERVKSFSAAKDWKVIAGGQHHTLAIDKDGMRLLCPSFCTLFCTLLFGGIARNDVWSQLVIYV